MASQEEIEAFFTEADTDNNGYLTTNELKAILKKKGCNMSFSEMRVRTLTHKTVTSQYIVSTLYHSICIRSPQVAHM